MSRFPILVLVVLFSSQLHAFSGGGHRVVAEIAWRKLPVEKREELVALLKHHPRFEQDFEKWMPESIKTGPQELKDHWAFLEAACWPDYPRGFDGDERAKYHRGTWHYINFPTYLRKSDSKLIDLSNVNRSTHFGGPFRDAPNLNIVQAIKANLAGLNDPNRTKSQRAVHLCWLMHLVGDAHQPLHSTAIFVPEVLPGGCRGGNQIKVASAIFTRCGTGSLEKTRLLVQLKAGPIDTCGNRSKSNKRLLRRGSGGNPC